MEFVIKTARDGYSVPTEKACALRHGALIAKRRRFGARVAVHTVTAPKTARVDHGRWLVDCECGAGVLVDQTFMAAYCMGCGAVHTTVVWPDPVDRLDAEHVLLARAKTSNRNWTPGTERLLDLAIENAAHGVRW